MKVKELMQLLESLNPEAELGIGGIYNEPRRFVWNKLVEHTYLPHSRSFTGPAVNEYIKNAEKQLTECKARKNSIEYKQQLRYTEYAKNALPGYVFTVSK